MEEMSELLHRHPADSLPTVGHLLAVCLPTVNQQNCQPSIVEYVTVQIPDLYRSKQLLLYQTNLFWLRKIITNRLKYYFCKLAKKL